MSTWAVINLGGKQYKITEGDTLAVDKVRGNKDGEILVSQILLVFKNDDLTLGKPFVEKAKVRAKVLENFRDKKIRVVKFKSKSRYLRTTGHRQDKTRLKIEKIQY